MLLDATTRSVQIVLAAAKTTNNCPFVTSYVDIAQSGFAMQNANSQTGTSNGTSVVTVVAAPGAGNTRQLKYFNLFNADTVVTTVTVEYNDNSTILNLVTFILPVGATLQYTPDQGWSMTSPWGLQYATNFLTSNVNLNNTSTYFDGPAVSVGTIGTWFVTTSITLDDTAGVGGYSCKLWDGTTIFASLETVGTVGGDRVGATLSGVITNPAGAIKVSVLDGVSTSGSIQWNATGSGKDSGITAIRIG